MKMRGLITSILTAIAITSLQANPVHASTPKVVVSVNIDQLSTALIEAYWELYREDGFKRLWKEGLVYRDTYYPLLQKDRANTTATLNTGTVPAIHGIVSKQWLDLSTQQAKSCIADPEFMGNYTNLSSSARNLLSSTITDELKVASHGKALVYSIAPEADRAILSAGHAADAALWFNQETGQWCGTTYYKEFPWWASKHNEQNPIYYRDSYLEWNPLLSFDKYIPSHNGRRKTFRHSLTNGGKELYSRVIKSPIINEEIVLLAQQLFEKSGVGEDEITDYVHLSLYAGNELGTNEGASLESQDTYIRLDRTIANILDIVDAKVGLKNAIVYITSTGYTEERPGNLLEQYNIPTGKFYLNRCSALLNLYLMAFYGEGQYVETYYDQQIYLNHKLIEDKNLDLVELQEKSALFLSQFSGVHEVYSAQDLILGSWAPNKEIVRNSYHKNISGDLLIEILPGWQIIENEKVVKTTNYSAELAPTIFLGKPFPAEVINTPIEAEAIAPTIAQTIRIRAPNASRAKAIGKILVK